MNIIRARVLDATHLELIQPIAVKIGDVIEISIPDDDENRLWKGAAAENFQLAYDTADSIYDNL